MEREVWVQSGNSNVWPLFDLDSYKETPHLPLSNHFLNLNIDEIPLTPRDDIVMKHLKTVLEKLREPHTVQAGDEMIKFLGIRLSAQEVGGRGRGLDTSGVRTRLTTHTGWWLGAVTVLPLTFADA